MRRRKLLHASGAVTASAIAGCSGTEDGPEMLALEIETTDSWEGTLSDDGRRRIDGSGPERYEWTDGLPTNVTLNLQKGPRQTELTATILADGEVVKQKRTEGAYAELTLAYFV